MPTERKATMLAIRFFSRVAEALAFHAAHNRAQQPEILQFIQRCNDHIEHIAQDDSEGLDVESRMRMLATALDWLCGVRKQFDSLLREHGPGTPESMEIDGLIVSVKCLRNAPAHEATADAETDAASADAAQAEPALEDPYGVINSLQRRIQGLEWQVDRERGFMSAELTGVIGESIKTLRAHSIIPLYVGSQEFAVGMKALQGREPMLQYAAEQVWNLDRAPLSDKAKDELRKAANFGMDRW